MKPIPLKNGKDGHIDPTWVAEWCEVYWKDDVLAEIEKARLWCLDNPEKRKKRLRAFLGNWIRRSCRLKPQIRMVRPEVEERPEVPKETRSGYLSEMKAKLREKV